jgi:hypothetical protein
MPYFWIADFTYWQAMRWKNHLLGSAVIWIIIFFLLILVVICKLHFVCYSTLKYAYFLLYDFTDLQASADWTGNFILSTGLLTAVRKDCFTVLNCREVLFHDCGDRVAQLLHVQSALPFSQNRKGTAQQEFLIVNTHLLFPHDSCLSVVRLDQVYKYLFSYNRLLRFEFLVLVLLCYVCSNSYLEVCKWFFSRFTKYYNMWNNIREKTNSTLCQSYSVGELLVLICEVDNSCIASEYRHPHFLFICLMLYPVIGMEARVDMFTNSWGLRGLYLHMTLPINILTVMQMLTG